MVSVLRRTIIAALSLGAILPGAWHSRAARRLPLPPDDPVLQALLAEALARSPELHAAQSAIERRAGRDERARALPDPMLSLTYTNDGWSPSLGSMPMTTLALMASQELPYPGKRGLRAELAASEARQIEPALARARLALEAAVKRAYYGLLQARELQSLTDEQRELWQRDRGRRARALRRRPGRAAGRAARAGRGDAHRAARVEQAAEAEIRLAELNRLLARPLDTPLETTATARAAPLAGTLEDAVEQARAVSPELERRRLALRPAPRPLALARREFKPDFTVQARLHEPRRPRPHVAGGDRHHPAAQQRRARRRRRGRDPRDGRQPRIEAVELQLRYRTQERFTRARRRRRRSSLSTTRGSSRRTACRSRRRSPTTSRASCRSSRCSRP